MIRLVCDGPGWTDDSLFFLHNGKLYAYGSSTEEFVVFNEPLKDSLATLNDCVNFDSWNDDEGKHFYFEGNEVEENSELGEEIDYLEEDGLIEYNAVKDYLEDCGFIFEEETTPNTDIIPEEDFEEEHKLVLDQFNKMGIKEENYKVYKEDNDTGYLEIKCMHYLSKEDFEKVKDRYQEIFDSDLPEDIGYLTFMGEDPEFGIEYGKPYIVLYSAYIDLLE